MDKQNTQKANLLFQLAQTYTLHNETIRHANALDLSSTHLNGITLKPHTHQHTPQVWNAPAHLTKPVYTCHHIRTHTSTHTTGLQHSCPVPTAPPGNFVHSGNNSCLPLPCTTHTAHSPQHLSSTVPYLDEQFEVDFHSAYTVPTML
jgi:hypothetical protein